ncbi:late endosomal/lysosomal adaptor and MAPK and MTOR activator-domain-containing protein [Scheffersomyces xylosifermentans]|uniref:late endosomal/lysosomal adaptor and MAPK and MTOR activator-domain-containing protein n=1 Tax=Scheffersomyces xylosifermentans TaxID=1304137 RepID=UPI00315DAB4B
MGICLSCLRSGDANDDDYNENSSLLRNQHNLYSDDYLQEEELSKQQQRQQELNTIVNDLSDNLIDVTSFLNNTSNNSVTNTPNLSSLSNNNSLRPSNTYDNNSTLNVEDEHNTVSKTFPYEYGKNEKLKILSELEELDSSIKDSCKISFNEPLYLKF